MRPNPSMRIQIASDLHLERRPGGMPDPGDFCPAIDRDLLVLAGDIGAGMSAKHFIEREVRISPVIYVPGNHEYDTGQSREGLDESWRLLAADLNGLHYLVGETVEIDGARFWGAPWYSDLFGRRDAGHLDWVNGIVTDFRVRHGDESPWTIGRHPAQAIDQRHLPATGRPGKPGNRDCVILPCECTICQLDRWRSGPRFRLRLAASRLRASGAVARRKEGPRSW